MALATTSSHALSCYLHPRRRRRGNVAVSPRSEGGGARRKEEVEIVGALVQWGNPAVCAARDGVVIPRLVRLGPFLEHTNFDCGLLEPSAAAAAPSP